MIKSLFLNHIQQLEHLVSIIPASFFDRSLAPDMFNLETNARIAANFSLRGYCPLAGIPVDLVKALSPGKADVERQIAITLNILSDLPEVTNLQADRTIRDRAGTGDVLLPQPQFIHQYIIPNLLFHSSMVYAIARHHGVTLSKGDFDGLHHYPSGFQFT